MNAGELLEMLQQGISGGDIQEDSKVILFTEHHSEVELGSYGTDEVGRLILQA